MQNTSVQKKAPHKMLVKLTTEKNYALQDKRDGNGNANPKITTKTSSTEQKQSTEDCEMGRNVRLRILSTLISAHWHKLTLAAPNLFG